MAPKSKMVDVVRRRPAPGTMAADRERIASAFEEMARVIRAGREGWGMRSVGKATKIIDKIPRTSKVMPELIEALIAHSGALAPVMRSILATTGAPVKAERYTGIEITAADQRKIEGLPALDPKDLRRG